MAFDFSNILYAVEAIGIVRSCTYMRVGWTAPGESFTFAEKFDFILHTTLENHLKSSYPRIISFTFVFSACSPKSLHYKTFQDCFVADGWLSVDLSKCGDAGSVQLETRTTTYSRDRISLFRVKKNGVMFLSHCYCCSILFSGIEISLLRLAIWRRLYMRDICLTFFNGTCSNKGSLG